VAGIPAARAVAGPLLAAAWDPETGGAAWCGAGARVALGGSGWPQWIRADGLWPRRHVATRAPPKPVQATALLGARSNAYKDNGGADRPRRRRVSRRLGVWPARGDYLDSLGLMGSEGARTGAGGRRGESGAGAGAATATHWCWRGCPLWSGGARWGAHTRRGDRYGLGPAWIGNGRHGGA
jgi:hypothetical protein